MAWADTKMNMTIDGGGDLVMDSFCSEGYYEQTSKDTGSLCWRRVDVEAKWEQTPAGGSDEACKVECLVNTSEDNVTWTGYRRFIPHEAYFRYIKFKVLCRADVATGYKVTLTRLEYSCPQSAAPPRANNVLARQDSPPGAPGVRDMYIVAAGAGDWAGQDGNLAICVETTGPTWRFILPHEGMKAYDEGEADDIWYDGATWRYTRFFTGRKDIGYDVEKDIANAVLQVVKSITWAAGDYDHDRDEFYIKIAVYTGTNPPVAVPAPNIIVEIYDDNAAAWVTIWTVSPGQTKKAYRISVFRAPDSGSDIWALDTFFQTPTVTAGAPFPAGLISRASGLRVSAMGDTGAKCNAWFYADRQHA